MAEQEDLVRQIAQWRGGPTLQKGFIDERGPPPPPADGEPVNDDDEGPPATGDSDGDEVMEDAADVPHVPARSTIRPSSAPDPAVPDEAPQQEPDPLAASAAGRGPSINTDPNAEATTPTSTTQTGSRPSGSSPPTGATDDLQGSSKRPHYEDLELDRERVRQRRGALPQQRNVDVPVDDGESHARRLHLAAG